MSFFDKLKASLKDKWLDYYQINHFWILEMLKSNEEWGKTRSGSLRPPAYLILGVISALEPRLQEFLLPFCELNSNTDSLIRVLGLDFNPQSELEKRKIERAKTQETEIKTIKEP